jgi:hypothetical protein
LNFFRLCRDYRKPERGRSGTAREKRRSMLRKLLAGVPVMLAIVGAAHAAPRGDCRLDRADHTVHGVTLGDSKSGKAVLGDRMTVRLHLVEREGGDFPWYVFASRDGKQTIAYRTHPGDTVNSYNEVEVRLIRIGQTQILAKEESYYVGREGSPPALATEAFVTGQGIRLGMTESDVTGRVGRCFKVLGSRGAMRTIRYEVLDETASLPILKQANMPSYYAEYQFERGRLVRYRFGYDYP